jgi:UDP-N-acetylmuramyl pentapeptide synthase
MLQQLLIVPYIRFVSFLAKKQLAKCKGAVTIGIAGSVGKTSAREIIISFLTPHIGDNYKIIGSHRNPFATALEAFEIPVKKYAWYVQPFIFLRILYRYFMDWHPYEYFFVDMSITSTEFPHNADAILNIIVPDVLVILNFDPINSYLPTLHTNIGPAEYIEFSKKLLGQEHAKVIERVKDIHKVFIAADAVPYINHKLTKNARIIGTQDEFVIAEGGNTVNGFSGVIKYNTKRYNITISKDILPQDGLKNLEAAAKITELLGFDIAKSVHFIDTLFKTPEGLSKVSTQHNVTIINSSGSTNFTSAKAMLSVMKTINRGNRRRRVVILGDFCGYPNKLLPYLHEKIVAEAIKVSDILILLDEHMRDYGIPRAKDLGFDINENLFWFQNEKQLSFHIHNLIHEHDIILVEANMNKRSYENLINSIFKPVKESN